MRGILLIIGIGLVGYAGTAYYLETNDKTWSELPQVLTGLFSSRELLDEIDATVAEIAPELPIQIDETTAWTGIAADGTTLVFRYVVDKDPAEFTPDYAATVARPEILRQICNDFDANALMRVGATYRSEFSATDGTDLGSFELDRFDCM